MAPIRQVSGRESRNVSAPSAAYSARAGNSGQKNQKQNSLEESCDTRPLQTTPRYPSSTEVFAMFKETVTKVISLQDEPLAKFIFEDGTPVSERIERACKHRNVDPAAFRPIVFLTKEGKKRMVCLACPKTVMKRGPNPLRHLHGQRKAFSVSNGKSLHRHPSSKDHLKVTAETLRIDLECLQNLLRCPVESCSHYEAGERVDALQRHVRQQHPSAKVQPVSRRERELVARDFSPEVADLTSPPHSVISTPSLAASVELDSVSSCRSLLSLSRLSSAFSSFATTASSSASSSSLSSPGFPTPMENEYLLPYEEPPSYVDLSIAQLDPTLCSSNQLLSIPTKSYNEDNSYLLDTHVPSSPAYLYTNPYTSLSPLLSSFEDLKDFPSGLPYESSFSDLLNPGAVSSFGTYMPYDLATFGPLMPDSSFYAQGDVNLDPYLNFSYP